LEDEKREIGREIGDFEYQRHLEEMHLQENEKFEDSMKRLGSKFELLQAAGSGYPILSEQLNPIFAATDWTEQMRAMSLMLLASRYQHLAAGMNLLKGHFSDSRSFLRKAIELCLFAVNVASRPDSGAVWLKSHEDGTTYRDEFGWRQLVKREHHWFTGHDAELYAQLKKIANNCSNSHIHPTISSAMPHVAFSKHEDGNSVLAFHLTDPEELRGAALTLTCLELVSAQLAAIYLFAHAFRQMFPSLHTAQVEEFYDLNVTLCAMHLDVLEHALSDR
jgi:hypothetical protein